MIFSGAGLSFLVGRGAAALGHGFFLCPFTKQRHQSSTAAHDEVCSQDAASAGSAELFAVQELVAHELDETHVEEDACRDGVKNAVGDERAVRAGRIRGAHSEANGDRNRGGEAERQAQGPGHPSLVLGPRSGSNTGAESETFKHLVKDKDNVERLDVFGDSKSQANEDGVKDDTKLENENRAKLHGKRAL